MDIEGPRVVTIATVLVYHQLWAIEELLQRIDGVFITLSVFASGAHYPHPPNFHQFLEHSICHSTLSTVYLHKDVVPETYP